MAGLAPRETVGSAIARTSIKAITAVIIVCIGLFLVPLFFILMIGAISGGGSDSAGTPRTHVAGEQNPDINLVAIPITGVILGENRSGSDGGGLFSALDITYGYTIKEELEELAEDDDVDGIILEFDTPGGTIFGSRAIADGIEAYQEQTGNPVIAYIGGISASGGVYAMVGADAIYADHGTLTGSIGVIFGPFQTFNDVTAIDGGILGGGVTTEGGIDLEYLTAGRNKDLGNPWRPLTDEERTVLQQSLNNAYGDFVAHVSDNRGIPESQIENDMGALIFGEHQAVANGLIDDIKNRDESYQLAAEAAGLGDGETWGVSRLLIGESGFFSVFAEAPDLGEGGPVASGSGLDPNHPLCLGTGVVLAYHGDPARLCWP